jgi:hypothetical protein
LNNDNYHSLKILIPQNISKEIFTNEFENYFKILFGKCLKITIENVFIFISISSQIENFQLLTKCIEFLQKIENPSIESILNIFEYFDIIFGKLEMNSFLKTIVSQLSSISKSNLLKISSLCLSPILKNEFLIIESEDSLFEFLNEYFCIFGRSGFYLFENIYFEYLKIENIEKFISNY